MPLPALQPGHSNYGIRRVTRLSFDDANARIREELQKEGFGVLTEIDVQATLKKKLDVDFPRYLILGACNPALAQKTLPAQPDVGLLLPCNVVVRETSAGVEIAALKAGFLFDAVVKDPALAATAADVEARLARAVERASAST